MISIKIPDKLYKNRQWLYHQYIDLEKNIVGIARELNCAYETTRRWLHKFNIQIRKTGFGKREKHYKWKGDVLMERGYIKVFSPEHSRANGRGYVFKHIIVAEQKLGRSLKYYKKSDFKNEMVHHIDGNKTNNEPENLFICGGYREHMYIHRQLEKISLELVRNGIIKFNEETKKYYIGGK